MIIQERDRAALRRLFSERLVDPVRLLVFSQHQSSLTLPVHMTCQWCKDTVALARELAELSDKITVDVHDFVAEQELAATHLVDKIPAVLLGAGDVPRLKYYGIPAGYEFASVVENIVDVSKGSTSLSTTTKERLRKLSTDVHIQVFVTPTCPFCPRATRMAHQFALESPHIRADAVEASEFPFLAQKYHVMSVPKVVMNETTSFEGAIPEPAFLLHVLKAADNLTPEEQVKHDALQHHDRGRLEGNS